MDHTTERKPSARLERHLRARTNVSPRCLDRDESGVYLGTSPDQVDRLIDAGVLKIVRLPVERSRDTGHGRPGLNRRVLIDIRDLDALIEASKETR